MFPGPQSPDSERHSDIPGAETRTGAGDISGADSLVMILDRGGGKTTLAQLSLVMMGARKTRRYGLAVCATQDKAHENVKTIGDGFESLGGEYPEISERKLGKYGQSRGWSMKRLRTRSGFAMDGVSLDAAVRGVKDLEARPDFIWFDDIDELADSPEVTRRKIETITRSILPAAAPGAFVLFTQNLILADGVAAQLASERPPFLLGRQLIGPVPAVEDAVLDGMRLVGGTPTWKTVAEIESDIRRMGPSAWLKECQHEVETFEGGMFAHVRFRHCEPEDVPDLVRVVVWVDPAVTDTDQSDSHGMAAWGIDARGRYYLLWFWEGRTSPKDAIGRAVATAVRLGAEAVGVETDQGGDTWRVIFDQVVDDMGLKRPPAFRSQKAGAGFGSKAHRASQMLVDYERGFVYHVVGPHAPAERALKRFPLRKPFDGVDAMFWGWHDLAQAAGDPNELYGSVLPAGVT